MVLEKQGINQSNDMLKLISCSTFSTFETGLDYLHRIAKVESENYQQFSVLITSHLCKHISTSLQ